MINKLTLLFATLLLLLLLLLLLVACQPISPTTTAITTTTIPSIGDSTAAIQATLDRTGYFYVGQNYRVEGTITPPNGSRIVFGSGGQFTRTASAPMIGTLPVILLNKSNVTLTNLKIVGSNPCYWTFTGGYPYAQYDTKREWNHAISIMGGSGYLIDNPNITSVWGDAINIDRNSQNITINNLKANCVGRSIVSNTGSTNTTINSGESFGAFWWTFNIEPFGDRVVRNYKVNNFKAGWSRGQAVFSGGPDFNCQVFDVVFTNLTLTAPKSGSNDFSIASCANITVK